MSEPVRVLHVFGRTGRGGAESRIMDIYRAIDRERVQFDFLVHADASATGKRAPASDELMARRAPDDYDEEIFSLGGRIYVLPRLSLSPLKTDVLSYRSACEAFFMGHREVWRVVQGHMTSTAAVYLAAAKRAGVPMTVAHSRNAGVDPGVRGVFTKIMRRSLADEGKTVRAADGKRVRAVDQRFACSGEAARAVFRDAPVRIIPNAIRTDSFRFRAEARERIRSEWAIGGRRVIGHVGSFRYQKNHEFLLRSFAGLLAQAPKRDIYRLLLVGSGGRMEEMRALAAALGISGEVVFAGNRANVSDYYQAMDIFAFPSHYEGLPGSVVEAQAAGLCCLLSDRITHDVDVTDLVRRADIGKGTAGVARAEADWTEAMCAMLAEEETSADERVLSARRERSAAACAQLERAGFDVAAQARRLERFYLTGELV